MIELNNLSEDTITYLLRLDYLKIRINDINYKQHTKNPYLYSKSFNISLINKPLVYGEHKILCQLKYNGECVKILKKYIYPNLDLTGIKICNCSKTSNSILYLIENIFSKEKRIACKKCDLYYLKNLKKMINNIENIETKIKEKNEPKFNYFDRDIFLSYVFNNYDNEGWILGSDFNIIEDSYLNFINTRDETSIKNKYLNYEKEINKAKKYIINHKGTNDFITTLKILLKYKKFISHRDIKTISYVCKMYKESLNPSESNWIGAVGDIKEKIKVRIISKPMENYGNWGKYYIYNFKDKNGNVLSCFQSKLLPYGIGEEFLIDFKITNLTEFKNIKKTSVKIIKYEENFHD